MAKEKAAFIIRSNELSAEKFTDQDYDNLGIVIESLQRMFKSLNIKNEKDARFVAESCLNLENQSTESKYYYWLTGSYDFSIKRKDNGFDILIDSSDDMGKEDLAFFKMVSNSILDDDKFRGQANIDVFVLDIDIFKRRIPIVAYYKNEPYVMK